MKYIELGSSKSGWIDITLNDGENKATIVGSYICDPIQILLKNFLFMFNETQKDEWSPIPAIMIDGEGIDYYILFEDCRVLVMYETEKIYSTSIWVDWMDICREFIKCLDNQFIDEYCLNWYDEEERENEKESIINDLKDIEIILQNINKQEL